MNAIKFCLILGCSITAILILGIVVYKSTIEFQDTLARYEASQPCIDHWVSQGVPRADIYRKGNTCEISRGSYGY
jgi:hypothetical protein